MDFKSLKIFFVALILSLPLWWSINILEKELENIFFFEITKNNPELFVAQTSQYPPLNIQKLVKPEDLEINAKSAISVLVDSLGNEKIIFGKNISERLPIASLTKLMTALLTFEIYEPNQKLLITKEAIEQPEEKGNLKPGEKLSVENLLHIMLIESSNDAAYALAEGKISGQENYIGAEGFVELMNLGAENLGLKNTHFVNPIGIDEPEHYSSSEDLVKLSKYIFQKYPQIFEISSKSSYEVFTLDGSLHHFIPVNTNGLLLETNQWREKIIGSKTGWTPEAGGCLLLVLKKEDQNGYLINVILGSEDRFGEMKKLINWLDENYIL